MIRLPLRRSAAIVLRQFYLIRGSPARTLPLLGIWVAIDIVLWGFITKYLNSVASSGFNFAPVLLGAVLFWDFFGRVMQGVTMVFFEDVWSRNFLNLFATPISIAEYLGGLVVSSMATSTIGLSVMILVATLAFGLSFFAYGLMLIPFVLVLFLFGITLGIVASSIVLRFGPASEWLIWPIPAVLSPFAGVFYPISNLPAGMQYVSYLLPPAYVFESLRTFVGGSTVSATVLLRGGGLALVYLLLACGLFARVHRHAVRTGLIARYSAESVS